MCRYLLDEVYELQDAVQAADRDSCTDELGDVLFVLLSCILIHEETGAAGIEEVAASAEAKLVRRHPHVFADRYAKSPEEGLRHWRDIKQREAAERGKESEGLLDSIPRSLPPLRRALTLQRKVASVGFEWETADQVRAKLVEETHELRDVLRTDDARRAQDELGDLLFSVVNLGRFLNLDPEVALRSTVSKFARRFAYVEEQLRARDRTLEAASLQEMDALWEESKLHEPDPPPL
jgi:tetrapyrrole methylase family protein/MazG family protein